MDPSFLQLIKQKLTRDPPEVFFLKREDLPYEQYPGPDDDQAYTRASLWFERHVGCPLILDDMWWKRAGAGVEPGRKGPPLSYEKRAVPVIANYRKGRHEYDELMELLVQSAAQGGAPDGAGGTCTRCSSTCSSVTPVHHWG